MSYLAYTELMRLLTGIEERNLERFFFMLSKHSLTDLRLNALKTLAQMKRATVSSVLKKMKQTSAGGTYISMNRFFKSLEKDGVLVREKVGRRTYWLFSDDANDFVRYLTIKT